MHTGFKLFEFQVAGRQPKLVSEDKSHILKGHIPAQQEFYNFMSSLTISDPRNSLNAFIPKFFGSIRLQTQPNLQLTTSESQNQKSKQWVSHLGDRYQKKNPIHHFIVLENLTKLYKNPNILDIKIGARDPFKQLKYKPGLQWYFILHGLKLNFIQDSQNNSQNSIFFSKYTFQIMNKGDDDILRYLALYFFDGKQLRLKLLNRMIQKLSELILAYQCFHSWIHYSVSVVLFYDTHDDSLFDVKLIDFSRGRYTGSFEMNDTFTLEGLKHLHRFLLKVKEIGTEFEQEIIRLKRELLKQNYVIIPERKIKQYKKQHQQVD